MGQSSIWEEMNALHPFITEMRGERIFVISVTDLLLSTLTDDHQLKASVSAGSKNVKKTDSFPRECHIVCVSLICQDLGRPI